MPAAKPALGVLLNVAVFALLLFPPARTLGWWRAWLLLGVVFVAAAAILLVSLRGRSGLMRERFRPPIQPEQPLADKILALAFLAAFLVQTVFVPLDVFRFHLMRRPGPLVCGLGLGLFGAGWGLIALALRENGFAAPVVKHQRERGHAVVDSGVYAVVRHPMYAGGALLLIGLPLWLESYPGLLLASLPLAALAARIVAEERFLRRELEGYAAYAARTRYRLIPFLW